MVFVFIPVFIGAIARAVKREGGSGGGNTGYFMDSYSEDQEAFKGRKPEFDSRNGKFDKNYEAKNNNNLKCPMCGSEVESDQKFCINCSYRLKE